MTKFDDACSCVTVSDEDVYCIVIELSTFCKKFDISTEFLLYTNELSQTRQVPQRCFFPQTWQPSGSGFLYPHHKMWGGAVLDSLCRVGPSVRLQFVSAL